MSTDNNDSDDTSTDPLSDLDGGAPDDTSGTPPEDDTEEYPIETPEPSLTSRQEELLENLNGDSFKDWYAERQHAQNIENDEHYFNEPGYIAPEQRMSPSKLRKCQRKVFYRNQNTPEEGENVDGVFWIGNQFENTLSMDYLKDISKQVSDQTQRDTFIAQDKRIWFEVEHNDIELEFSGEIDPVITARNGDPLLVTEIKTTSSDSYFGEDAKPNLSHKAQLHAYLEGLNREYDHDITHGIILYAHKRTLDVNVFEIEFDRDFWEDTLDWAAEQAEHRLNELLPEADDPLDTCGWCEYSTRCGEDPSSNWSDIGADGFVPLTEYIEENTVEYLRAESERNAKLTPTLAYQHPQLTDDFDVHPWECDECGSQYDWDAFDWDGDTMNPPTCTNESCTERFGELPLRGPLPDDQLTPKQEDE